MGLCSFSVLRSWWLLMGYTHDYWGAIESYVMYCFIFNTFLLSSVL